jgi:roadblock/LC7 domain-containing protein
VDVDAPLVGWRVPGRDFFALVAGFEWGFVELEDAGLA